MIGTIDHFMTAQPAWRLLIFLLLLLLAVGTVDTITGFELSFSIFYTIPVGLGSWYLGRCLGYLDLDGFKAINDQLGHNGGDQVLQAVAAVMRERLRASDIGGRIGGDEFAILLPETGMTGAKTFFTKLRENLNDLAADKNWQIGFSIGVAILHKPAATSDTAIHYADSLMYKVKKSGKNSILFAEY